MAFFKMREEYKNKTMIGKDRFLKNARANLTQREYDLLARLLLDYQIEYVLTCKDGKQIVMVNAAMNTDNMDAFTDVSDALLSCMPQEMLLYLRGIQFGKMYTATRKLQKNNPGKAVVLNKETSFTFHISDVDAAIGRYLRDIEITPIKKMTSYEVIKSWGELIHIANQKHRKLVKEKNRYLYHHLFYSARSDEAIVEHDDPESCLELKDKIVEEACNLVDYIWGSYLDETELDTIDTEEWLSAYVETINEYIRDYAYTLMTESDVRAILESFDAHYESFDDALTGTNYLDPSDILLHMYSLHSELWNAEEYERKDDSSIIAWDCSVEEETEDCDFYDEN